MKYFLFATLALALSGCKTTVKTDEVKVKTAGYEVEFEDDHHHGDFCPPGQSQKGRC